MSKVMTTRDADLQRPSITIIISNYNQAEFLDDSLLGIAEQTEPADKVIIIDDGSTDGSINVIESWIATNTAAPIYKKWKKSWTSTIHQKGFTACPNRLFSLGSVRRYFASEFLQSARDTLAKHPNAGLCFSELSTFTHSKNEIERFSQNQDISHIYDLSDLPEYCPPNTVRARMNKSYFPPSSNTVVAKVTSLKNAGNFMPDLQWHSDWFAYNVIALRDGACHHPKTLALIRVRQESYSASGMSDRQRLKTVLNNLLDVLEKHEYKDIRKAFTLYPASTQFGANLSSNCFCRGFPGGQQQSRMAGGN